jgi:hypothetical protein
LFLGMRLRWREHSCKDTTRRIPSGMGERSARE